MPIYIEFVRPLWVVSNNKKILTSTKDYDTAMKFANREALSAWDWIALIGGNGFQVEGGLAILGPSAVRHIRKVEGRA